AATDHGHRPWQALQTDDVVAGDGDLAVEHRSGRSDGARADGDHDRPGAHRAGAVLQPHRESVGVLELGLASDHRNVVAPELVVEHVDLPAHDVAHAGEELLRGRPGPSPMQRGHGPHRLTERLARNRAGLDADAPDAAVLLDDRDALAQLGGLHGGALARGPAPDRHQVEVVAVAHDAGLRLEAGTNATPYSVTPAFCQSSRKRLRPMSVSGCLMSCWKTANGSVATSAPASAASTTC